MFNLLRMDMYQIFKGSLFRVFIAFLVLYLLGMVFLSWLVETQVFQAQADQVVAEASEVAAQTDEPQRSQIRAVASLLLGSGIMSLLVVFYIAVTLTNEFNSGYIRNVLTARVSRASYFFSKAISIIVISFVFTLVGVVSLLIFLTIFGTPLEASPLGDIVVWSLYVVGLLSAMSMLVGLISWLTRSKVVSVICGIVITSGLLVSILNSLLSNFPTITKLFDYTMSSTLNTLSYGLHFEGAPGWPHIVGVAVGFFILYGLLSYLSIKKRDV